MAGSDQELQIAGYRVVGRLGAGGMGEVYLVEHPRLPRRDALKLLDGAVSAKPEFQARFIHEADLLAPLSHPNIVHLYDRGQLDDGRLWLTMEYVQGTDAKNLLREQGPLPLELVAAIVRGVADALDYAYTDFAITHRDIKPANLLVRLRDGRPAAVKLVDFGIAKASGEATSLTATGMTVGTLGYLSPEAIGGAELDNRTDLYSLATAAYELLTGAAPFTANTIAAVMGAHLYQPVPPIDERGPGLPAELAPVFARALAKEPADRYSSSGEFAAALTAIAERYPDARAGGFRPPADEEDPHYAATVIRATPAPPADAPPADSPPAAAPSTPQVAPAPELRRGETVNLSTATGPLVTATCSAAAGCDLFALVVDAHDRVLSDEHLVFYNNPVDPDGAVEVRPAADAGGTHSVQVHPDLLPDGARVVVACAADVPLGQAGVAVTVRCGDDARALPAPADAQARAAALFEVYHRTDAAGAVTLRLRALAQGWDDMAGLVRSYGVDVDD